MVATSVDGSNLYLFVIDTGSYAGNFEREMCAYVTGQVGDCQVGEENAEIARKEIPDIVGKLEQIIESVPDDNGCFRPVSVFIHPQNGKYNRVAIFFAEKPEKDLLDVMKTRAQDIAQRGVGLKGYEHKVKVTGFRLLEQKTTYNELPI